MNQWRVVNEGSETTAKNNSCASETIVHPTLENEHGTQKKRLER